MNKSQNPGYRNSLQPAFQSPKIEYEPVEESVLPPPPRKLSSHNRPPPPPPKDTRPRVQAQWGYEAQDKDEISLQEGDVIAVVKTDESGWSTGENTRTHQTGLFPANYCVPVEL